MSPILDQRFLHQTQFDSAAPAGTAVVVHKFESEGEFQLLLHHGRKPLRQARLNVQPDLAYEGDTAQAQAPGRRDAPAAVALDIATLLRPGVQPVESTDLPGPGYLSLTSSQPIPEHHLVVRERDGGDVVLDTRRLGPQSLFAVTLVRPGRYRLANTISGAEAAVVVTYPKVGKTPYRPPEPLEIDCGAKGFGASTFTISPAQGIIFRLSTESRIQLELVEPDDGPKERRPRPKASLRTPAPPPADAS
jgi:hypothetical protein